MGVYRLQNRGGVLRLVLPGARTVKCPSLVLSRLKSLSLFIPRSFLPALTAASHGTTGQMPGHPAFTGLKAGSRGLIFIQMALDGAMDPKTCGQPPFTVGFVLGCACVNDGIACYCTQGFCPEPR